MTMLLNTQPIGETSVWSQLSKDQAAQWDALVDGTPGTDVTQLGVWAQVRAGAGFKPLHVLSHLDGALVGGAQILTCRVPMAGAAGYLPYGPVVDPHLDHRTRAVVVADLADALRRIGGDALRMMFVQPPEGAEDISAALLDRGFRASGAAVAPAGSVRIDLHEDLAVIRARFGRRLRSWTNRWPAHGVAVRRGSADDVPVLVDLMQRSARRQGYASFTAEYVAALYDELAAVGHAVLFVGEVDGSPVAADLMTGCGDMLRGRLSGFDRTGAAAQLSVPAAVRWEMIQWAKNAGYRWFDFGGLHDLTLTALFDGPTGHANVHPADQPKLTFGGTPFRYPPAVELIGPAPVRWGYDLLRQSRLGRRCVAGSKARLRTGGQP